MLLKHVGPARDQCRGMGKQRREGYIVTGNVMMVLFIREYGRLYEGAEGRYSRGTHGHSLH